MDLSLSVVTPSLNQGRFIWRTIESVLAQNMPAEYLIVDGGSTDETLSVLRSYQTRIRWISEPDRGHANAINKGISETHGDVIGWLNSDDMYYPRAFETVVSFMRQHPDVDVVYGDANHVDDSDQFIERYPTQDWDYAQLAEICFISQPAAFFRRRAVQKYGLLDEGVRYCIDYDYWLRLARDGAQFAHIPDLLAATRLHKDASTIARRVEVHAAINDVTRRHFGRTPDRWLLNYAHAVLESKPRSRPRPHTLQTLMLAVVTVYAALRWNHSASAPLLAKLSRWIAADVALAFRARATSRQHHPG